MWRACNWKVKKEQLFLAYDTRYEISDIGLGMRRNIEWRQAIVYVLVLVNPSFYSKYFTQAYIILLIKTEAKFSISGEFDHWKDSVRFMLVIGQCNRSARIMYARCCGAFLGVNFVAVFFLNLFWWKFIFDRDLDLLRLLVHPFDLWRTSLSVGLHFLHIDEVFTQSKCS